MNEEISAAIAMLEQAKTQPVAEAKALVNQAIARLIEAMKTSIGPDVEAGPAN